MATGASVARANASVDAAVGLGTWIQLHVGSPGAAGTANVATNTTRQSASFVGAAAGTALTNAPLNWTSVPAGEDYTFFTMWTLASGGTFLWSGTLAANAVSTGDNFSIPSGGLAIGITPAS